MNELSDFFFSKNALQNYFSEIIGIIITVLIVDTYIRYRERHKNLPLKRIAYSLLWEKVNDFLSYFLPSKFKRATLLMIYFNEFYANTLFNIKEFDSSEIVTYFEEDEKADSILAKILVEKGEEFLEVLNDKNKDLTMIQQYESDLSDLISRYGNVLDYELIILMNTNSHNIKKHFLTWRKQVQSVEDFDKTKLDFILPMLIEDSIIIREFLWAQKTN